MRFVRTPRARTAFLVLVFSILLAGDAWRYTIGWAAFTVLALLLAAASVALLLSHRAKWRLGGLPYPLLAFLVLATASLLWSFYPGATALGLVATWVTVIVGVAVAVLFDWAQVLRGLGLALRLLLGLSLLFELYVSLIIRHPVLPLVASPGVDYANLPENVPPMLFWSRNELFEIFDGGKIQGVFGNSTLLSFVALIGIIVFFVQLADRTVSRGSGLLWLLLAFGELAASRSATNIIGFVVVAVVLAAVLVVRRAQSALARGVAYAGVVVVFGGAAALALVLRDQVLDLLGKTPDLTNRTEIWNSVIDLAQQRPVAGWGWVSYWVPWVAPFDTLAFNNGIRQLHAHNAWLDVWFQLGILGLIVFGALVLSTLVRSWAVAVDRPQALPGEPGRNTMLSALPLLVLVTLLVQSLAESRMLVEFGLAMLVIIAVKTKTGEPRPYVRGDGTRVAVDS